LLVDQKGSHDLLKSDCERLVNGEFVVVDAESVLRFCVLGSPLLIGVTN